MRIKPVIVIVLLMSGLANGQATTQPAEAPPMRPARGQMMPPARGARGMTPEQREAALRWANENMPDLVKYVREYGAGRGAVPIMGLIRSRMMALEEAPADPAVRDRIRRNMTAENQVGQLLNEMQTASPQARAEIQKKIEATIRENVEGMLAERQERIDRLKNRLEMEQRTLDQDRQGIDLLVTRRLLPFRLALPGVEPVPQPSAPVNATPATPGQ